MLTGVKTSLWPSFMKLLTPGIIEMTNANRSGLPCDPMNLNLLTHSLMGHTRLNQGLEHCIQIIAAQTQVQGWVSTSVKLCIGYFWYVFSHILGQDKMMMVLILMMRKLWWWIIVWSQRAFSFIFCRKWKCFLRENDFRLLCFNIVRNFQFQM